MILIAGVVGLAVLAEKHRDVTGRTQAAQLVADASPSAPGPAGGPSGHATSPFYVGQPGGLEGGGGDELGYEGLPVAGGDENPAQAEAASLTLNHPPVASGSQAPEEEPFRAPVEQEAAAAPIASASAARSVQPPVVVSVKPQPQLPPPPVVVVSSTPQPTTPAEPAPPIVVGSTPQPQAPGEPVIVHEHPQPITHG